MHDSFMYKIMFIPDKKSMSRESLFLTYSKEKGLRNYKKYVRIYKYN